MGWWARPISASPQHRIRSCDRSTDSDEYDDSVLIHEYAHMLAAGFRGMIPLAGASLGDTSIRGWRGQKAGQLFPPPFAMIPFIDSQGPGGVNVLRFDVEENYPPASSTDTVVKHPYRRCSGIFMTTRANLAIQAQFDFA